MQSCRNLLTLCGRRAVTAHQATLGEDELGAKSLEQDAALGAHGVRHRQDELVALGRRDVRQTHPRVAAGRLHLQCESLFT